MDHINFSDPKLRNDPGIIRNRLTIQATVENARTVLALWSEHGSLCNWFYNVLAGTAYPALQKALRGTFTFMGPEISRIWLMASGRTIREEGGKDRPYGWNRIRSILTASDISSVVLPAVPNRGAHGHQPQYFE